MRYFAGEYDVAVIGAGHAGIEAALACARLGLKTIIFTLNLDAVGNMPCNPSIGGTAKGHLVRELDALGGEMAKAADKACIQFRMLNRGKGPAVHSLRAQADRREYQKIMKNTLERQENLTLRQAEVVDIETENGAVSAVVTHTGATFKGRRRRLLRHVPPRPHHHRRRHPRRRPDGMFAAVPLGQRLRDMGLTLRRFKTGTPMRLNGRTIDYSEMEIQPGDDDPVPFSFRTAAKPEKQKPSAISHTRRRKRTELFARTSTAARFTRASSRASARGTARRLRTRSSALPTKSATSSSSSRWGSGRTRCTSRASPPAFPRTCSCR